MKKLLILALCALLLAGCFPAGPASTETTQAPPSAGTSSGSTAGDPDRPTEAIPGTTLPPDPVQVLMENMTIRELVGQLFMVCPEDLVTYDGSVLYATEVLAQGLERYPVGGVILFGDNIQDPDQLRSLTGGLGEMGKIPLFLGVDEEGGNVARLANKYGFDLPKYKSAAAVGLGVPEDAYEMGRTIGGYLKDYGFNLDFAPVADVNTNPDNPVIGSRAFSSDPEIAAQMAAAFARGLREAGILPTFKHFPGHGDTGEDSHTGMAVTNRGREEMRSCEWLPFALAGEGDLVMVGHISAPALTGDDTPATMSRTVVTDILRGELGFSGLVVTDSLAMGAITQYYTPEEAAVAALEAGCDLLLMPEDLPQAMEGILSALDSGRLTLDRIRESVERILNYKIQLGILPV